jgi:hypothetical protein
MGLGACMRPRSWTGKIERQAASLLNVDLADVRALDHNTLQLGRRRPGRPPTRPTHTMCDDSEGLNSVLIRQACRGQLMNGAHCDGAQSFGLEEVVRKDRQVPDARVGVRATEVSIPPRLNEITTFAKAKRGLCRLGSRGESELKGRALIRHCASVLWHADRCGPVSPNAGSPGRNRRRVMPFT